MVYSMELGDVLKHVLPGRARSLEVERLKSKDRKVLYSIKLGNKKSAKRKGFSQITITQVNGEVILEDLVSLEEKNRGFESDIASLKCCMYYDLGAATPEGGVSKLGYTSTGKGYIISFKVGKNKAPKALHHYVDTAVEVMSKYFRGLGEIDLAFSMARERGEARFRR